MTTIRLTTAIAAAPQICFDLARNVDAHLASAKGTRERAVAGVTHGLLSLGDEVTWEAVHFGVRQRLRVRITELDAPYRFVDEMIEGAFTSMRHEHVFVATERGTERVDRFDYVVPLGILGNAVDALLLRRHMRRFLEARNAILRELAERR